jgi:hypothetical protein
MLFSHAPPAKQGEQSAPFGFLDRPDRPAYNSLVGLILSRRQPLPPTRPTSTTRRQPPTALRAFVEKTAA